MAKFYFTYGMEGHPFVGGWTEVIAETRDIACELFRLYHPNKEGAFLNCSWIYSEEEFRKSRMSTDGNFGQFCHETICLTITKNQSDGGIPNG